MGLNYDYHVAHVIGDGLLQYTLMFDYRDIHREFRIMATAYASDINRKNAGYIHDRSYKQFFPQHNAV